MINGSEQLFLRSISELREKLKGDGYDYLKASGILRHLFLDGGKSLVMQANRNYKIKWVFKVRKIEYKKSEYSWNCITPQAHEIDNITECNFDQFLSTRVLKLEDYIYSVADIILYSANIMGGIHSGLPKTTKEIKYMEHQNPELHILGASLYAYSLCSILEVAIEGLLPLELLIRACSETTKPCDGLYLISYFSN